MRPSTSYRLRGAPFTFAVPMLLAALVGGCSADATEPGPDAENTAPPPAGAGEEAAAPGSPSPNEPGAPPAPAPAPGPGPDEQVPPAPKTAGRIAGYAYLANAVTDAYTAGSSFSFSASGGAIEFKRGGAGQYSVTFEGLTLDKSVALVSAYSSDSRVCTWNSTAGSTVGVRCYDAAGVAADSRFVVTVVDEGEATGASVVGYVHAHDMNAASYTPQASRSNNAGGGDITATRSDVGLYKLELAGLSTGDIGNVQVTAYGSSTAHCVVQSWGGGTVNIRCFDETGAPADAQYVAMLAGKKLAGTARISAFAHASDSTTLSYAPSLMWSETDGTATATRSDVGIYSMTFGGLDLNTTGHVQVSAYAKGRRCNVGAWAGTTANVSCVSAAGTANNNQYAIVVVQ